MNNFETNKINKDIEGKLLGKKIEIKIIKNNDKENSIDNILPIKIIDNEKKILTEDNEMLIQNENLNFTLEGKDKFIEQKISMDNNINLDKYYYEKEKIQTNNDNTIINEDKEKINLETLQNYSNDNFKDNLIQVINNQEISTNKNNDKILNEEKGLFEEDAQMFNRIMKSETTENTENNSIILIKKNNPNQIKNESNSKPLFLFMYPIFNSNKIL